MNAPTSRPDPIQNATHQAWQTTQTEAPDMGQLDSEADTLRDLFKEGGITALVAWHNQRVQRGYNEGYSEAFRMIAAMLWARGDANIRLAALAYVGGLDITLGKSMSEWAKEIGCTKAAISKEANRWADKLNKRSSAMKSEQARDSYHRRQRGQSRKSPSASSS